ncbi:MAG: ZIP family metal transporter [Patescibacteria group bacterium]|jgi:zinc and cadmium transporter|nr:ZIP family metal transporter [Patescibacteria group bacterium]
MNTLIWIIISAFIISLTAWVGLITLILKEEKLKKILLPLVAFSAGSLIGGAFLHLIPEALERESSENVFFWLLIGFLIFFLMEQFLHWHHCHRVPSEHKKPVTYLILISDGIHNFIDGMIIAGSFLINVKMGIITWLICLGHEIPQEIGEFGILLHGGWKKYKALLFNFVSALMIIPGGLFVYFISQEINTTFLLSFAAGNFIYIAASDLIPEIKTGENLKKSLKHFFFFILGILFIFLIGMIE